MSIKISYLKAAWYTTRFLAKIEQNRQKKTKLSISDIEKNFLEEVRKEGIQLQELPIINQAYWTMLAYAILVSPREIVDNASMDNQFPFVTIDEFSFIQPKNYNRTSNNILKKMRNSVSHAYIDSNEQMNKFVFRDKDFRTKKVNFHVEISTKGFCKFLEEVAKYYDPML